MLALNKFRPVSIKIETELEKLERKFKALDFIEEIQSNWSVSLNENHNETVNFECNELNIDINQMYIEAVVEDNVEYQMFKCDRVSASQMHCNFSNGVCGNMSSIYMNCIYYITVADNKQNENPTKKLPNPNNELLSVKELNYSEQFYDLTFAVEDKVLHAHRAVLALKCSYFADMFKKDEFGLLSCQERIVLDDVEYSTMKFVIDHIYTGSTNILPGTAEQVMIIAERFNLPELKAASELLVSNEITNEFAIEQLILADRCNAASLKNKIIAYIVVNRMDMFNEKFKGFIHQYPTLTYEILEEIKNI